MDLIPRVLLRALQRHLPDLATHETQDSMDLISRVLLTVLQRHLPDLDGFVLMISLPFVIHGI